MFWFTVFDDLVNVFLILPYLTIMLSLNYNVNVRTHASYLGLQVLRIENQFINIFAIGLEMVIVIDYWLISLALLWWRNFTGSGD